MASATCSPLKMASFSRSRCPCCRTFSAAPRAKRASRLMKRISDTSAYPRSLPDSIEREFGFMTLRFIINGSGRRTILSAGGLIHRKWNCGRDLQSDVDYFDFFFRDADDLESGADRISSLHVEEVLAAL